MPIIIHIVDEDAAARAATSYLLANQGYSPRVYGCAAEFLDAIGRHGLGERACLLLSVADRPEACFALQDEITRQGIALPLIGMSGDSDMAIAVEVMKRGAADFLRKPVGRCDLVSAVERALERGGSEANRLVVRGSAAARLEILSQRERQILRGLLAGMSNKEIARRLDLSPRTVEMHRANMMADLALSSLAEAIRLAIEAELSPLEQSHASGAPTADALRPPQLQLRAPRSPAGNRAPPLDVVLPPIIDALEGTTDCLFLLDRNYNFTYLNGNAVEAIAQGRELVGANMWASFPRTQETRAAALLRKAADERKSVRFDFFHPDLARWFDVSVRPIPSGLQVFFRDLTAERAAARGGPETEAPTELDAEHALDTG